MNTTSNLVLTFNNHKIRIIRLDQVDSTNDYAKKLLSNPFGEEDILVFSSNQTSGRGNGGNSWESEAGKNLTFSLILRPNFLEPVNQFQLNKVIALAIRDFVYENAKNFSIKIKWPNDIYVNDKKIAGTLIEHSIMGNQLENSIVGIGININQEIFKSDAPNPVSLLNLTNKTYDLEKMLQQLVNVIYRCYQALKENKTEQIDKDYLNHLYCLNELKPYNFQGNKIMASIQSVNHFGQLQLITENNKLISCAFKEIEFL
ncbi:MAG: biotin--[acetyl-CoA-carboxylase] ligase [Bacteroidota bacterium]